MLIDKELYDKASEITYTDYNEIIVGDKVMLDTDSINSLIEDLICEIHTLQEKNDDLEQDIQDNYKPISKAEQYDCELI